MAVPSMTRHLQASFTQDYAPSPSSAKKDLLELEALDDEVRSAADMKIQAIRIDSQDAKLLAIPDVCTITNKDTRMDLNKMCEDMMEAITKDQDKTAPSASTTETVPEENEEFFLNLFTSGTSSSSSKMISGGTVDSKEDGSDLQKRRSSRRSTSRFEIHQISFIFLSFHLFIGRPVLLPKTKNPKLKLIDLFQVQINQQENRLQISHLQPYQYLIRLELSSMTRSAQ